jgi:hypothetical protein
MKTQMPFNNEIEKTKKEIEVLTKKLSFLEELSQTKTPCEEAFKRVYGYFPTEPNWDDDEVRWESFQNGYNASKVSETPEEPEELKTLYQMFYDEQYYHRNKIWHIVKRWLSQYEIDGWEDAWEGGFSDCLDKLNKGLK